MRVSARNFTLATAGFGALVTFLALAAPFVPFGFRNPSLHVTVDATEAFIAALVAYLLLGRLSQTGSVRDLGLIFGLAVLSATNLLLALLPADVRGGRVELFTWMTLACRLLGSAILAASAFIGDRGDLDPRRARVAFLAAPALVGLIAVTLLPFADSLPLGISVTDEPGIDEGFRIEGHPVLVALQLVGAALYFAAAVGFTRRADKEDDDLMRWFGAAAALGGFARVNFFFFPSLYSSYVYTGDVLRLGFYLFLLIGATREIVSYWESRTEAARLEERRRLARDLHDGLAQELVVVASQSRRLERSSGGTLGVRQLVSSVDRAVGEARRAIAALTVSQEETIQDAITDVVEEVATRTDGMVDADLDPEIDVSPDLREHLVRIVREALTNASRHAQASMIAVRLRHEDGLVLEVFDDGIGFDPAEAMKQDHRFGLVMMKERAEAMGGAFVISSTPGGGTVVRLELP